MSTKTRPIALALLFVAVALSYPVLSSADCETEFAGNLTIIPSTASVFPAGEASGIDVAGGGIQHFWCEANSYNIGYNSSSIYGCCEGSTKKMTLIDEGQGTDFNREALDPSLTLWMNMSGSGDDASLYRFPATESGTLSKGEGKVGFGMNFDSAYYNLSDNSAQPSGGQNLTATGWFKINASVNAAPMSKEDNDPVNCGWAFFFAGGYMYLGYDRTKSIGTGSLNYDQWYFYSFTYDNEDQILSLYVDGSLVSSVNDVITQCANTNLYIGSSLDSASMTGQIDDARMYNRTLSDAEILAINDSYGAVPPPPPPPGVSIPDIVFVSPTPNNEIVERDYADINLTVNESATCILEWNGVNESMSNLSENYYVNKTYLYNGNYTFKAYCDNAAGMNMTEDRWVYVNRTEWVYSESFADVRCTRAGAQIGTWIDSANIYDLNYNTFGYNDNGVPTSAYCKFTYNDIPKNIQKIKLQFKIGQSGSTCWQTSNITYPSNCTALLFGDINFSYFRFSYFRFYTTSGYTRIFCSPDDATYIPIFECQGQDSIDDNIWESNLYYGYGDAPETPPTPPEVAFVSPTPNNEIVTNNYTLINVSMSTGGNCILEWNGVNETITNLYDKTFNINKTDLGNGNYTFLAYCQDSLGTLNNTETRWVFINYTAPTPAPPAPPSPISSSLPFIGFIFGFMGVMIALGFLDVNISSKGKDGWKDQLGVALAVTIGVILVVLAFIAI